MSLLASTDGHGDAGICALPRALVATGRNLVSTVRIPAAGRPYAAVVSEVLRSRPAAVIVWSLAPRAFIYRYIQRYGTFSGFAPYGADALILVATAARRAVSVDPQRVRGRLEAGAIEAISGAYNFRPVSHGGLERASLAFFVARQGS